MNYIIGDIGNTSTRICLLNKNSKIIKSIIFDTKKVFLDNYVKKNLKMIFKEKIKKKVLFSSVVPHAYRKIKTIFKKKKL